MPLPGKAFALLLLTLLPSAALFLNGCCLGPGHQTKSEDSIALGPMPVAFINPAPAFERHIWVFSGSERVKLIRQPGTGNMILERPPIAEFKIKLAHGRDWHEDKVIFLPANSRFVIYEQAEGIWGPYGRPNEFFISTGTNPAAVTCRPRTPSMSTYLSCAACIQLPYVEYKSSPLNLKFEINPGLYIKQGIVAIINYLAGGGK